jgi:hypothetical protein
MMTWLFLAPDEAAADSVGLALVSWESVAIGRVVVARASVADRCAVEDIAGGLPSACYLDAAVSALDLIDGWLGDRY